MKIIGITGKSGSGKSTFASLLSQKLNCQHIDIDKIAHIALLQPEIIYKLCNIFGNNILHTDGSIDRKKLGSIVFVDKNKIKILEDLTYIYMQKYIDNILSKTNEFIILEYILLPNTKYWKDCDCKILITSNDFLRKKQILKRDNISSEYFYIRDSASIDYSPYKFDFIFENNYTIQATSEMVEKINNQYIRYNKQ